MRKVVLTRMTDMLMTLNLGACENSYNAKHTNVWPRSICKSTKQSGI